MNKITESIFYTGVLNPNLRVFDIIMRTDFGTSYNSYLVKGKEKLALVETAHSSFFDYFIENVKNAAGGAKIDYLILNHCEPDHTGSVAKLLKVYPDMQILTSAAGAIYIKQITNLPQLELRVVRDGETLDLGGRTLQFISAPFLHWPDSMFTYCPEEKAVFTCDFLGSHYCEPQLFDNKITYKGQYLYALKNYFDAIFGPFLPYVRKGLEKLEPLGAEYFCTSHGPVLTKGGCAAEVVSLYKEWSAQIKKTALSIPIFYCSAYGNTEKLAKAVREGILSVKPAAKAALYNIIEYDLALLQGLLNSSDAFLIGTPTLNRDAVAPVWQLLAGFDAINAAKRPCALFGSFGWSGEALPNVTARLTGLKCAVFDKQLKVNFTPSQEELDAAKSFGAEFAAAIADLK